MSNPSAKPNAGQRRAELLRQKQAEQRRRVEERSTGCGGCRGRTIAK